MRLTWRKRSAAPRELLVLVLFLVAVLVIIVVFGERNRFPAAKVGHRVSSRGILPAVRCDHLYAIVGALRPDSRVALASPNSFFHSADRCDEPVTAVTAACHCVESHLDWARASFLHVRVSIRTRTVTGSVCNIDCDGQDRDVCVAHRNVSACDRRRSALDTNSAAAARELQRHERAGGDRRCRFWESCCHDTG